MTLAKCRQVVDALLSAGYMPTINRVGDEYEVRTASDEGVNVNVVKTFADNQAVNATVYVAVYR